MTENIENTELLDAVAAATENTEPDPKDFDITDWLTPSTQKDHRKVEKVNLVRDFTLEDEINKLNQLRRRQKEQPQGMVDPDASVADASDESHIEQRMQKLSEKIAAASITVKVRAMLEPEINRAIGKLEHTDPQYWYNVFAESVILPNGKMLPVDQWPAFHNTIGEAQFGELKKAFRVATFKAPAVNAPF